MTRWFAIAITGLIGVALYSSWGKEISYSGKVRILAPTTPVAPAQRISLGIDHADLWPVSRSLVWNVDLTTIKQPVGVCVRTTESKYQKGVSPWLSPSDDWPREGTEKHGGWIHTQHEVEPARVTFQFFDFREVGLEDAAGKQPMRMLVKLRAGGGLLTISGKDSILPGTDGYFQLNEATPRWVDDELLLLALYTRSGETLYSHYVIVQKRNENELSKRRKSTDADCE